MSVQKSVALVIYSALIFWAFSTTDTRTSTYITWFFAALFVIHLIEFMLVFRMLASTAGSMANHFIQVLVFGYLHWLPLKKGAGSN